MLVAWLLASRPTEMANISQKYGLAVPSDRQVQGMQELQLKAARQLACTYHQKYRQQSTASTLTVAAASATQSSGLQDLYNTSVGLSKATKVLLNLPSYAVQVYGNAIGLAGMGVNPFSVRHPRVLDLRLLSTAA